MLSRRRILTASGGIIAAAAFGLTGGRLTGEGRHPARPPVSTRPVEPPPASADEARRAGWTVVTDFGAVGDGRSRRLSTRYGSLGALRRDFPSAGLDDELDGAAIQAAVDSGADRVYYPPGRYLHTAALVVRNGQRHVGAGPDSTLVNVRRRDTAFDDAQAHSFQIGNVHPVAMVVGDGPQSWAVAELAPIAEGDRSVTVRDDTGSVDVRPGDIVMIRSDNPPTPTGQGLTYDFQMWNRVAGWDPGTGALDLELPVPRTVVGASSSPTELAGPRLCTNAGSDRFMGQPWSFAQNVEIGHLRLDSAGLSARNGVWRGWFHDLVLDAENMVAFNALVQSAVERVSGTWTARMIEIKHASHDSTVRDVTGTFRAAAGAVVRPAVSIGEQSFACTFDGISCTIGRECREPVRALEIACSGIFFRGRLEHFGTPRSGQVWAVKSNDNPANPPSGVELDLLVRAGGGFAAYGVIGNETRRPSYPTGLTLRLDQESSGEPPPVGLLVVGGSGIRADHNVGDSLCATVGPAGERPEGMASCG